MWPTHCVQNSHGAEFHKDLIREETDLIIDKGTLERWDNYSGFGTGGGENTGLADKLKAQGVTHITCVGLAYDYCVGSTAADGAKLGFNVSLV